MFKLRWDEGITAVGKGIANIAVASKLTLVRDVPSECYSPARDHELESDASSLETRLIEVVIERMEEIVMDSWIVGA
jgi:hypothetical protein